MFSHIIKSTSFVVAFAFLSSPAFALHPTCSSPSADADGDGYGWEDNTTCLVRSDGQRPACKYTESDPDGDGWGWENNISCLVTEASISTCLSAESDPDGDGWGWEEARSCRVSGSEVTASVDDDLPTEGSSDDDSSQDDLPEEDRPEEDQPEEELPNGQNLTADSIYGAWQSECTSNGDSYIKTILAIDESIIAEDVYQYADSSCSGVPQGLYFPIQIYNYTIGSEIALGEAAWELDTEITQVSDNTVFRDGAAVGQQRFGLIGLDDDRLYFSPGSLTLENRSTSFGSSSFTPKQSLSADISGIGDLVGLYQSGCLLLDDGGSNITITTVTQTSANLTDYLFLNDFCAGPIDVELLTPSSIVPEPDPSLTFFGDHALNIYFSRDEQQAVSGADLLGGFEFSAPRERYSLFALVNEDTLMRGDCVTRESTCKTSRETFADMIDFEFNSSLRFKKVDSIGYPLAGSSDTSAISGLWDFSDPAFDYYAYQEFDASGQGIYYELEGESITSADACIRVYPETITVYEADVYQQVYNPGNPDEGYVIYSRYFVDGDVLVGESPGSESRFEYPALQALPSLPDCV